MHLKDMELLVPFFENHSNVKRLSYTINQRIICRNLKHDIDAYFLFNSVEGINGFDELGKVVYKSTTD